MKKSVETQLVDFLAANPSKWASGELQRLDWRNKNGTLATPRSIVRRLEENAVDGGKLQVSYHEKTGTAMYQIREEHRKKEQHVYQVTLPVGTRGVRLSYV